MKYLFIALAAGIGLASCARPNTPPPPKAEPIGLDSPIELRLHANDSGYTPSQVVRRRLFGLLPPKAAPLPEVAGVPRKCKGCTFNLVTGNQTNSTVGKKATAATAEGAVASVVGKKAGPAIVASDSVQQNAVGGPGNILATNGNNNTPTLSAPVQQPPDWRAMLAKPGGYALASIGTLLVVGGSIFLIAAYRRRKKLLV